MSTVTQASLFAGRNLRRFFRAPPALIYSFAFPVLLLLTQYAVFGRIVGDGDRQHYLERLAPLVVLSTAAFGSPSSAVGFLRDLTGGLVDRLRVMPVRPGALLVGRLTGDVLRIVLIGVLTTAVAMLLGFRFRQGAAAVVGFFAVLALFGAMWAAIALWRGSGPGDEESLPPSLTGPATLLFIFSSGFVPVSAFPSVVQPLVRANPFSTATEALVGLSSGGPVLAPVLQTLAWVLGLGGVCLLVAVRRFARRTAR
ncbi:ABC transporter permease [Micromonospora humi]|uniref:Transport permease protein n=1 Tax=Micromonospora humi TaxID=745366 RepID=A0A1C5H1V3_9ACTN|nr:ABC transporter permease [Micromonospora humi]SCG39807.1 ABC-2 type transport system permease protein [Micromonospora humi]